MEMKIGYPCINRSLSCKGNRTFRLRSYTKERLQQTIQNNLDCLSQILRYNLDHGIFFFRISSDLIPFASHPICTFPWQRTFHNHFSDIGQFIKKHEMRISMHPDQFIVLTTPTEDVFQRSVAELAYHAEVLDLMKLDTTAKIQLHIGCVYGNKSQSIKRFINRFNVLDASINQRLVIENDEKSYSIQDCLRVHKKTNIPILFDYFHHSLLNNHESLNQVLDLCKKTWMKKDGVEIGVHGLKHDGKLFSSRERFMQRATQINRFLQEFKAVGFRAPLTHRQPEWMQALEIEYDLSFFDSDPYEPIPGGTMCIWPFFLGNFVELPYTLVQDYTLTSVLGESTPRLWLEKVDFIEKLHGMALINSHPDYLRDSANLKIYADFLLDMKHRNGFWHALPRDVARWWRARSMEQLQDTRDAAVVMIMDGDIKISSSKSTVSV